VAVAIEEEEEEEEGDDDDDKVSSLPLDWSRNPGNSNRRNVRIGS